ncbi:MAG: hypothetical protein ACKOWF_14300 [Chloroflexota bacterium]
MEQERFDRIARLVGGSVTRRAGIAAGLSALGSMLGRATGEGPAPAAGAAARSRAGKAAKSGKRRVHREGPCGDGSRKDNVCTKNGQCCTGYCLKKLNNRDGKGRCRCIRKGKPCNPSQTCCRNRQCVDGRCGGKQPGPTPDVCMVCASGCKYTSVSAAYAGEPAGTVIPIDAGRYGTGIAVTKSMTLKACNGVEGVILYPDGSVMTDYYTPPRPVVLKETTERTAAATVTLIGLALEPSSAGAGATENLIEAANWDVPTLLSIEVEDCDLSGVYICMLLGPGSHVISGTSVHDCTESGVYVEVDANSIGGRGVTLNVLNSTFTGNTAYGLDMDGEDAIPGRELTVFNISNSSISGNGLAGMIMYGGTFNVTGCRVENNGSGQFPEGGILITSSTVTIADTTISGNSSLEYGGGLKINDAESSDVVVTIAGTTTITGNNSPEGSGIGVSLSGNTATISGASGRVSGNTGGDQCARNTTNPANWSAVANCAF